MKAIQYVVKYTLLLVLNLICYSAYPIVKMLPNYNMVKFAIALLYPFNSGARMLVYSQACFETGGFKSGVYKQNNNAFGMRKASGISTQISAVSGFATYLNVWSSVLDFWLWHTFRTYKYVSTKLKEARAITPQSTNNSKDIYTENYVAALVNCGYMLESEYLNYVENMLNYMRSYKASYWQFPVAIIGSISIMVGTTILFLRYVIKRKKGVKWKK